MANCAFTDYWVKGDAEQLNKLFKTMKNLEERKESLIENGYGKRWLGNLVAALGGDPMKIYCRGQWSDAALSEDHLYFFAESAWREMEETRLFLEKRFPGIKILYQCCGDGFWYTNDKTGEFACRYYLDTEEEGEEYYHNLRDLLSDVEHITGSTGLLTLNDCERALERHCEENDDAAFNIGEFEIVD